MRTVDELTAWTRRQMEQDYAARPARDDGSKRQSREDWQAGYLAALERFCPRSAFRQPTETTAA